MKTISLVLAATVLISINAQAGDASLATGYTTAGVFQTGQAGTYSTLFGLAATLGAEFRKILVEAKDDMQNFTATNGEVRTVKTERAFQAVRQMYPQLHLEDMEIAWEVIAQ
ncbi:hypothetical protein D3C86_1844820 [compost metagenome]